MFKPNDSPEIDCTGTPGYIKEQQVLAMEVVCVVSVKE
jgi:hypothetical protein